MLCRKINWWKETESDAATLDRVVREGLSEEGIFE